MVVLPKTYHGTDQQPIVHSFAISERRLHCRLSAREDATDDDNTDHDDNTDRPRSKKLAAGSLQCPGQRVAGAPHLWQLRCGYRLCCNFSISGSAPRAAALRLLKRRWST